MCRLRYREKAIEREIVNMFSWKEREETEREREREKREREGGRETFLPILKCTENTHTRTMFSLRTQ